MILMHQIRNKNDPLTSVSAVSMETPGNGNAPDYHNRSRTSIGEL
jgi:hypothetical protein